MKLYGQGAAKLLGVARMLQGHGALDVSAAVQAGRQLKVALANGSDRFEKSYNLFGPHRVTAAGRATPPTARNWLSNVTGRRVAAASRVVKES